MNLDKLNEQGVREAIIYPFLKTLGYEPGSEADIIFEYRLHYDRFFLGHKTKNDPILRGRADYVCQILGVTRWTIEAKPPSTPLTKDDVQQAFTYAAHPEVAAPLFVITNGHEFRIYKIHNLEHPELTWSLDQMPDRMPEILAILSPDAIRHEYGSKRQNADLAIAPGVGLHAKIAGGAITYRDFYSPTSSQEAQEFLQSRRGVRSSVGEGLAQRMDTGQLRGEILVIQNDAKLDALARLLNLECFVFECADFQISTSVQTPSIFTGRSSGTMPGGTDLSAIPGTPAMAVPFDIHFISDIRISGFLDRDHFKGSFEYRTAFSADPPGLSPDMRVVLNSAMSNAMQVVWGDFDLTMVAVGPSEAKRIEQVLIEARQHSGTLHL